MRDIRFLVTFVIMIALQILICNYLNLSCYLIVSLLPMMIMILPGTCSVCWSMIIAFLVGLSVDFLSDGLLGLNTAALVLTALLRFPILKLFFQDNQIASYDPLAIRKAGTSRVMSAILISTIVFMAAYVWIDSAGTRSPGFNFTRFVLSCTVSTLASTPLCYLFVPEERSRWK